MNTKVGGKRLSEAMLEPAPGLPAESRLDWIRQTRDIGWLRRVVSWTDYPVSIRVAAELRLRKLQREKGL